MLFLNLSQNALLIGMFEQIVVLGVSPSCIAIVASYTYLRGINKADAIANHSFVGIKIVSLLILTAIAPIACQD